MKNKLILLISIIFSNVSSMRAGDWQWATSAAGSTTEYGKCVGTDGDGNVYAAGTFLSDTLRFENNVFVNAGVVTGDIYLAKYSATGNLLWVRQAGGNNDDDINALTVDHDGNVYMTGLFYGVSISFGNIVLTNAGNANYDDIYLAKYDSAGNVVWARRAGGTNHDQAKDVALDNSGNIYITGALRSYQPDFGSIILTNTDGTGNSADMFIAKYDTSGSVIWAQSAGVTYYYEEGNAITTDEAGNIYSSGFFGSPELVLDSITLTNIDPPHYDMYIVKYDPAGNVLWAKRAGGDDIEECYSMKTDNAGHFYMTGYSTSPEIIFANDTFVNPTHPFRDMFIFKYDTSGNELWARTAGGGKFEDGNSLDIDPDGNVYVIGSFSSALMDFGTFTLDNSNSTGGYYDTYIAKYTSTGSPLWARNVAGSFGNGIAIDETGGIYVTGQFGGLTVAFGNIILNRTGGWDLYVARLNASTGLQKLVTVSELHLFPSVTSTKIHISGLESEKIIQINIFNSIGAVVFQSDLMQEEIDVRRLENGVYFCVVEMESGERVMGKFVKE